MEPIYVVELAGSTTSYAARDAGYFPVICALDDEECVVALRGGAGHIGLGGRLELARSTDRGATWHPDRVTLADSERDDRNPAIGVSPDGHLVVAYHWQGSYDDNGAWDRSNPVQDTRLAFSSDRGHTWSDDHPLLDFTPLNGESPFGKIRTFDPGGSDQVMLMPIYGGTPLTDVDRAVSVGPATCPSYLLRSVDGGRSWGDPLLVAMGLNEADVLFLPDGDWLFAARSEDKAALYTCRSSDGGGTWGDLRRVTEATEPPAGPDSAFRRPRVVELRGVATRRSGSRVWSAPMAAAAGRRGACAIRRSSTAWTWAIRPRPVWEMAAW